MLIISMIYFNRFMLSPSKKEEKRLNDFSKGIDFTKQNSIIEAQNRLFENVAIGFLSSDEIDILKVLDNRKGYCYDRSLVLQKLFLLKGFQIRPVYLFYNKSKPTTFFDFIKAETHSHNLFEIYLNKRWYVVRTNTKMLKFESLEEYIVNNKIYPSHSLFIRHLNNRNGRFIFPSFVPDIY